MTATTTTITQYRVLVKFRWSSRFVAMKNWYGVPATFGTEDEAHTFVQRCLDPDSGFTYGYRQWPFEGAEFRTEGRTITTTREVTAWKPAHKVKS